MHAERTDPTAADAIRAAEKTPSPSRFSPAGRAVTGSLATGAALAALLLAGCGSSTHSSSADTVANELRFANEQSNLHCPAGSHKQIGAKTLREECVK